jgi:hypothetical protein
MNTNRILLGPGGVGLLLACWLMTACSTVHSREKERLAAYQALPPSVRQAVDHKQVEPGMDTNAVFFAWGPPSAVEETPSTPPQTVWIYYGSRAVLHPGWSYLPTSRGYWTLEYTPVHHAALYTKAQVVFQDGRVVEAKRF